MLLRRNELCISDLISPLSRLVECLSFHSVRSNEVRLEVGILLNCYFISWILGERKSLVSTLRLYSHLLTKVMTLPTISLTWAFHWSLDHLLVSKWCLRNWLLRSKVVYKRFDLIVYLLQVVTTHPHVLLGAFILAHFQFYFLLLDCRTFLTFLTVDDLDSRWLNLQSG